MIPYNYDNTWTDREGNTRELCDIGDDHLLNIQQWIKRQLLNLDAIMLGIEALAIEYNDLYADKDWYSPVLVPDENYIGGELKIALEVNRRKLLL